MIKSGGVLSRLKCVREIGKGLALTQRLVARISHKSPSWRGKLDAYSRLCRFDKPIGAMLLYWPTAWGVLAGAAGLPSPYLLGLFLMGSWTSRSAGCIVNDYLDRDFDKHVQRTKSRPLATQEVSVKEAGALLFLNLTGGLVVLFHLPTPALIFTLGIVGLAAAYPLAKRYTNYPQLVLGIGFNSGIVIGALTASPSIALAPILALYGSGICWTMVYDTVYAYQDIEDDLKLGVKSTAIAWRKNPKQMLEHWCWGMVLFHGSLPLFDVGYFIPSLLMVCLDGLLLREVSRLDLRDREACGSFFLKNNYYGMSIFLCLLLLDLIRWQDPENVDDPPNSNCHTAAPPTAPTLPHDHISAK